MSFNGTPQERPWSRPRLWCQPPRGPRTTPRMQCLQRCPRWGPWVGSLQLPRGITARHPPPPRGITTYPPPQSSEKQPLGVSGPRHRAAASGPGRTGRRSAARTATARCRVWPGGHRTCCRRRHLGTGEASAGAKGSHQQVFLSPDASPRSSRGSLLGTECPCPLKCVCRNPSPAV